MIADDAPAGWEVLAADFGGQIVQHRHGDVTAVAYIYSNREKTWAECTACGAALVLETDMQRRQTSRGMPSAKEM